MTSLPVFYESLVERARELSTGPARLRPSAELPAVLRDMKYDEYRKIRFRPERSLWRGEPGRVEAQFFHLGFYYREPVMVHVIEGLEAARAVPFAFSPDLFTYEGVRPSPALGDLGFAGVRLHAPLNTESYRDEIIVFQGASYFRTLGRGQVYGLSARGLAIDFGLPAPEEFPRFTELYLVRPRPTDTDAWVLGLLESRRATGAYAFRVEPGTTTVVDVTARVFLREPVTVLGIAPLTSMFLFGEEAPARFGDFRPEVHDSDGLAFHGSNGEWLFRPLRNPPRTTVSSFRVDSPRGFGLLQRDRNFDSYQDLEARYQDRPSIWVEPLGDWGRGGIRLLEIATNQETDDNIALAWVPDTVPEDGLSLRYRLHAGREVVGKQPAGRVVATRVQRSEEGTRFLVDFALTGRPKSEQVELSATATGGRVIEQHVEENPFAETLRGSFLVEPDEGTKDVELRCFLRSGRAVLTETWSYLWQANR